ncbi:hypothetical protein Tco_0921061 [Tanacetum coccineum]
MEYGKPGGVKLSVTFDALNRISGKHRALFSSFLGDMVREHIGLKILAWNKVGSEARDKLWDEITVNQQQVKMARPSVYIRIQWDEVEYSHVHEKMKLNKMKNPPVVLWLKGRVNKDGEYQDDEIRSVGDKLKLRPRFKEGTFQVRSSTDANDTCTRTNKQLMKKFCYKKVNLMLRDVNGRDRTINQEVSPVEIHPINSNADEEGGTTVVGCDQNDASIRKEMQKKETVKSVGAKKTTTSIQKDSSSQDSQSKENVSVLPQAIKCRLWHLKKSTIIAEGSVYKSDGKIMLHNKALPKDCYKVSIDKSLGDASFIPDVGNNGCTTVLDAVGGFVAWPKNQVVFYPKATPPSTIQMITVENKTAPKVPTKRKNFYVSSDAMQKEANKKRSQKALHLFQGRFLYSFWHKAIFFPPCKPSKSETYVSASVKVIDCVQLGTVNQAELKLQPRAFFSFCTAVYIEIMSPRMTTRSAGQATVAPRGGRIGERTGRGGGRTRGRSGDQVPDFSTIIPQQLQNLLPTILAQVGDQGSNLGNGRNQNGDAVNDNIQGNVRNVIENNDRRGCAYKEFLACNPKESLVSSLKVFTVTRRMHSNTSRILDQFSHELKKLIAHFIPMVAFDLLRDALSAIFGSIRTQVLLLPGSVITTGSILVTPGSVITTGSILVTPGSVITTGSILVTPGSVITTGSILVTPGVITTDSILVTPAKRYFEQLSSSVRDPKLDRNGRKSTRTSRMVRTREALCETITLDYSGKTTIGIFV